MSMRFTTKTNKGKFIESDNREEMEILISQEENYGEIMEKIRLLNFEKSKLVQQLPVISDNSKVGDGTTGMDLSKSNRIERI